MDRFDIASLDSLSPAQIRSFMEGTDSVDDFLKKVSDAAKADLVKFTEAGFLEQASDVSVLFTKNGKFDESTFKNTITQAISKGPTSLEAQQLKFLNEFLLEQGTGFSTEIMTLARALEKGEDAIAINKAVDNVLSNNTVRGNICSSFGLGDNGTSILNYANRNGVWNTVSEGFKKLDTLTPEGSWARKLATCGLGVFMMWFLVEISIADDIANAFAETLKILLDVAGDVATAAAEVAGDSLWAILKPFLLPIGIVCLAIFVIAIIFTLKGGNPKNFVG